jgi:hypothetical protein
MREAFAFRPLTFSFAAAARWIFPVLVTIALLCGSCALFAQATGQISGVVSDPAGQVMPGVRIELTNVATAETRNTTTVADGTYAFPLVNPGTYQVKATATGFKTVLVDQVLVQVNGTSRVDVHLAIGGVVEEVTVTGAAPLVETGNATLGTVVDHQAVVDLPLNGRNFAQLGTLIPGVIAAPSALGGANGNATPGGFGNTTGSFNVNGMRNQSNSFLLDGAPNNDSFNSGFVMRPPPDAIEEFKIMTHSYDAQYGRSAGAIVNVVTRSGTNAWHGSVWEFNREAALAAKNFFTPAGKPNPNYQQNQFGGAAGGKIIRDRLFVFGFYEGFRLKDATSNVLNQPVLSQAMRGGDFSEISTKIIDPQSGKQFAYQGRPNVIDPARISAVSSNLLNNYIPLPNAPGNFYTASPPNIDNRDMWGIRGDLKLASHSVLGRYMRSHQNLFGPITPSNFAPAGNRQIMTLQDAMGSDTWVINSQMINVARYARQWIDGMPNQTSGLDLATSGYVFKSTNPQAAGLPNVTITSYFTQGDAQQPFASRSNSVDTISDDFTWTKGRHNLQFGGEFRRDGIGLLYINRPNGAFTFNANFTGYALADFLLGYPYMFQQGSGDPAMNGKSWTYSGYAQDQFRISPKMTIVVGGRYEVNLPYTEAKGHLAALHPGQQSTVQPNAPVGLVYPGDKNTPDATYYADTNNISPRLAAIYDPAGDGKTVLRAAYGIYFDTVPGQGDFFQNGTLAPPFQPLQEIDFYQRPGSAVTPNWFSNPYAGVSTGAAGFPPGLTFIGWGLPHSYKAANIQHYNLGIEHQFTPQIGFELGYVGTKAKQLPIFIEVNPTNVVASTSALNAYAAGSRAVFPSFGLTRPTFSAAKSWYDSLQARMTLRSWHRATATAAYTWSRSIDDVSGLNIGNDSRPILPVTIGDEDSIDRAMTRERGNSLFDTRNRFVLSFGYELPPLLGKPSYERLLIGGWQINGIFQAQSGNPFTVVNSATTAQSLTFRPNMTCNPNNYAKRNVGTTSTFFNTACFALPMVGTRIDNSASGNEPRGVVVGPGFNTTDASIFKIFRITERQHADFRFEVFNVFNEAHFAQPGLTFGAATFGRITSTVGNDSRVIQLAFKYGF